MEYNSSKELLVIPEYGRHVQNLIGYCKSIEDKAKRQAIASRIVELMAQVNPQNRNIEGYHDRLWHHFFQIANYDINVLPPWGKIPTPEDWVKKPEIVGYPSKDARFRHYGSNVQKLIAKAISMPDGPKKDAFVEVIASYMKLAYKTWNREHFVSDDMIIDDLESLSGNNLKVAHNADLDNLTNKSPQLQPSGRRGEQRNGKHYQGGSQSKSSRMRSRPRRRKK